MRTVTLPTSAGPFTATFSALGLARLEFPLSPLDEPRGFRADRKVELSGNSESVGNSSGFMIPMRVSQRVESPTLNSQLSTLNSASLCLAALEQILAGQAPTQLPPLDLSAGTDFQRRVWQALGRIPPGQTRTYGQIALEIGAPRAVRAVGAACGANPIPLLVPCHRVVPKAGGLGGFSGGWEWKRLLLARENRIPQNSAFDGLGFNRKVGEATSDGPQGPALECRLRSRSPVAKRKMTYVRT
jgi:O-6-methylguanine DNA methyltransferase